MKRPPRVIFLVLLVLLGLAIGVLNTACDCRDDHEAYLCFTPANPSLAVGDSLQLTATLKIEEAQGDEDCIKSSGWRWVWRSDDGGEIEFGQIELQWSEGGSGIYIAQVDLTAVNAGTVSVTVEQPRCSVTLDFMGTFSCVETCSITITTTPMMW